MTTLPDAAEPMSRVERWLDEAAQQRVRPNPSAMTLATVAATGRPSARVVLIKRLDSERGYLEFYTNYGSRKAAEIGEGGWTAGVVHWDALGRQMRFEGPAVKAPGVVSDAYFATRPWRSQINAWASRQSAPLDSREALEAEARALATRFHAPDPFSDAEPDSDLAVPRPAFWGGYRLWLAAVEFWTSGGRSRFHDRIRYERELTPAANGDDFVGGPWNSHCLQP